MRSVTFLLMAMTVVTFASGCSRDRYRMAATRDAYRILNEKSALIRKPIPQNYAVTPDVRSRFYDPTNPNCPQLPVQRPVLNGYPIPQLATDTPSPPIPTRSVSEGSTPTRSVSEGPVPRAIIQGSVPAESRALAAPTTQHLDAPESLPPSSAVPSTTQAGLTPAGYTTASVVVAVPQDSVVSDKAPEQIPAPQDATPELPAPRADSTVVNKVVIPQQAWEVLPQSCLDRMFEFSTLREEYEQSFQVAEFDLESPERRLTLANLMELATINSREYQTRKEALFATALVLTRQRYQFDLNPSPFGNGTAANYVHSRNGGIEVNRLGVPTGVGVERTLATGGEFLARFANSVVLTFNGPSGFAADVGSEMIFDFQQTIFQRDVRFESLTQAERNVVYATRDYLRFRKQLFRDIANQYYNLLLNYRGIEINAQDYFTNLRGFLQSQAEYRTAEKIPRIQVDQFEQNVLRARSNLVSNCFSLEAALDQLKFRLGLPTEMNLYLDLTELESISLKDELSVARQMITRARAELLSARSATTMDATTLANVAEVLADRMSNILRIQQRMEGAALADAAARNNSAEPLMPEEDGTENSTAESDSARVVREAAEELVRLQQELQILGVWMQVDMLRTELDTQIKTDDTAPPLRVLIRAIEFSSAELQVIDLATSSTQFRDKVQNAEQLVSQRDALSAKLRTLEEFLEKLSIGLTSDSSLETVEQLNTIPQRMKESLELVQQIERLTLDVTRDILPRDGKSIAAKVQEAVDETIELSDRLLAKGPDGWEEIHIDHDEALLTGLVQRLDLMNERGDLADAWRRIKLAGDDLRSIVDLRANHSLRTKSGANDPFDFTFDDSETRLSVALDTPLNRRLQRNNFRLALINYNVGLRNLMAAEDSIKLDVREDLRQLALDRNQYAIAVASAALAYERVISTRLRLQLAVQNVAARDFLEAQQAYTNALSAIARQHVNYIVDRTELFFDLEAFDVDNNGYWAGVKDDYGPQPNIDFRGENPRPYDHLPPRVWYSPTIRQMEQIGPGDPIVVPQ